MKNDLKKYQKYYRCEDWTVEQIAYAFKGGDSNGRKIIIPLFQRGKRWDAARKIAFMQSLRSGFPVGSMLFAELEDNKTYSIVDGLQRGSTICDYIFNPTSSENLDEIDTGILDEIRLVLFPNNCNLSINKDIEAKIFEYFESLKCFDDVSISKISRILLDNFVNSEIDKYDSSIKLSDILDPWFKNYKEYYENISKAEIPVIIYVGEQNYLCNIFEKINRQGLALTDYEIYASSWLQYRKEITNDEIVNFVLKKYDILENAGFVIQDYSSEELRISKYLLPFEYLFGLGKWLVTLYGVWLRAKFNYKDDEICEIGFEIVNICINNNKADVANLDKRLKEVNWNLLTRRIKEAIEFTKEAVNLVSAFKGNSRKPKYLHAKNQILSMVGFVFREMYDINDLSSKRITWINIEEKLAKNLLNHYVYDIINGFWSEGSEKPYYVIKEKKYNEQISLNAWATLLNNYFENSLLQLDKINVSNPTQKDQIILNCIYLDLFTAKDQLGRFNFDIEHIATKKIMTTHVFNTGLSGLPISSIANQCYLPVDKNRSKKENTIYQFYKKDSDVLKSIEEKYSFTEAEDLEWIELPFEKGDDIELKKDYETFLRKRFNRMQEKFLKSIEVVRYSKWEEKLKQSNNQTIEKEVVLNCEDKLISDGDYDLSNMDIDFSGMALCGTVIENRFYETTKWKKFLNLVCEIAYNLVPKKFEEIVLENIVHKKTSKLNPNGKDPIISKSSSMLQEPIKIGATSLFTEGCISSTRARVYALKIAELFGLQDKIIIKVKNR